VLAARHDIAISSDEGISTITRPQPTRQPNFTPLEPAPDPCIATSRRWHRP
jgi:hypothetical protein